MLFHFVQRTHEYPDSTTNCLAGRPVAAEDVVKADFEQWTALWQKLSAVTKAPWRTEEELGEEDESVQGGVGQLNGVAFRVAARTFKEKTAIGVDAISPKQFG